MIIGLSGQAGSGKDFVADLLVQHHGFTKIALADPLKRICQEVFEFSDEQLWGRSEERNKPDGRYFTGKVRSAIVDYEDARILLTLNAMGNRESFPTDEEIREKCKVYLSPREALQSLGTEWGRNCCSDVWIVYTLRIIKKLLLNQDWKYDPRYGVWQDEDAKEIKNIVISDLRFQNEIDAVKTIGGKVVRIHRQQSSTLSDTILALHTSETEQLGILDDVFDYVLDNQKELSILQQDLIRMLDYLK